MDSIDSVFLTVPATKFFYFLIFKVLVLSLVSEEAYMTQYNSVVS